MSVRLSCKQYDPKTDGPRDADHPIVRLDWNKETRVFTAAREEYIGTYLPFEMMVKKMVFEDNIIKRLLINNVENLMRYPSSFVPLFQDFNDKSKFETIMQTIYEDLITQEYEKIQMKKQVIETVNEYVKKDIQDLREHEKKDAVTEEPRK